MAKQLVEMELIRGTKNTWVYGAEGEVACAQVYLAKGKLPDTPPPTITLTVEWKGDAQPVSGDHT